MGLTQMLSRPIGPYNRRNRTNDLRALLQGQLYAVIYSSPVWYSDFARDFEMFPVTLFGKKSDKNSICAVPNVAKSCVLSLKKKWALNCLIRLFRCVV
uniref:Uncharacterized protein n=1 Tax=Oryza brachyantha TaxID=4533 RepID=J3L4E7_ORYBR